MTLASPVRTVHVKEPAEVIWEEVGDLSGIEPILQQVLLGLYVRKEGKTASGIYVPTKVFDEDQYQSRVGLVLKVGPRAFVDDPEHKVFFHGYRANVGDWQMFKPPNSSFAMQIGAAKCYLIPDVYVSKMRVAHPDLVY